MRYLPSHVLPVLLPQFSLDSLFRSPLCFTLVCIRLTAVGHQLSHLDRVTVPRGVLRVREQGDTAPLFLEYQVPALVPAPGCHWSHHLRRHPWTKSRVG